MHFLSFLFFFIIAWLDDRLTKEDPVLGEEWDFVRPHCINKHYHLNNNTQEKNHV